MALVASVAILTIGLFATPHVYAESDSKRARDGLTMDLMLQEKIYKTVIPLIQSVIQIVSILAMDNIHRLL